MIHVLEVVISGAECWWVSRCRELLTYILSPPSFTMAYNEAPFCYTLIHASFEQQSIL